MIWFPAMMVIGAAANLRAAYKLDGVDRAVFCALAVICVLALVLVADGFRPMEV